MRQARRFAMLVMVVLAWLWLPREAAGRTAGTAGSPRAEIWGAWAAAMPLSSGTLNSFYEPPMRLGGTIVGGVDIVWLTGELESLGYTQFILGGHTTLCSVTHRVRVRPAKVDRSFGPYVGVMRTSRSTSGLPSWPGSASD
jgi:hypothetical protein